jgi:hypothetical protein
MTVVRQHPANALHTRPILFWNDDAICPFSGSRLLQKSSTRPLTTFQTRRTPLPSVIMSRGERSPLLQQRFSEEGDSRTVFLLQSAWMVM